MALPMKQCDCSPYYDDKTPKKHEKIPENSRRKPKKKKKKAPTLICMGLRDRTKWNRNCVGCEGVERIELGL